MKNTRTQTISELTEAVIETQAITCAVCGKMIEGLIGWDIATTAYDDGWRMSDEEEPYCPKCTSEFIGLATARPITEIGNEIKFDVEMSVGEAMEMFDRRVKQQ